MLEQSLSSGLWAALGGAAGKVECLEFSGPYGGLPSSFEVGALASASIGVATLAAAELWAARRGGAVRRVRIDRRLAAAAFRCERLLAPQGWTLPAFWDPLAGDYRTADGWIRLHTNYSYHRDAALRVLDVPGEKEPLAQAVKRWAADELESAIVDQGGCAAALRTMEAWSRHPQGAALADEPLVAWEGRFSANASDRKERAAPEAPLSGIRVLDLTRVIAGPVGARHLAAFGAQVLRIDPPGFEEAAALLPETTRGKRCAALDLKSAQDRSAWERLVAEADVLIHGYRPGAMEALGYDAERLRALNPALVLVRYDAYGWSGPWARRRGFDSLVQMSTGIANPGNDGGSDDARPTPLPAQALDHGTGYLVAAAACRALSDQRSSAHLSLARTAKLLIDLGRGGDRSAAELGDANDLLERSETAWGPVKQVPCAGRIDGCEVKWAVSAGRLGRDEPRWLKPG
jgi:CoA-transferase family III